jgi:putative tryptophan/tyrosine transport system substrate-binding protein
MRRRDFIVGAGVATAWPLAARAQQRAMPVIGFLSSFTGNPNFVAAFKRGLGEAGYTESRNVEIDYRWIADGQYDRLGAAAADLVARRPAVIFSSPIPAALAAKAATTTIPIVFAIGSDPVESGLVASLNRPGGNITGTGFVSVALGPKRMELLREIKPAMTAIALLVNPNNRNAEPQIKDTEVAAQTLGLRLHVLKAGSPDDLDAAFAALAQQGVDALIVGVDPFFLNQRERLTKLAARHAVPAIYVAREFTAAGGLMSYGSSFADAHEQAGIYAGRILKGEKPADLPVVQSAKFEFVMNLKTATALGIVVPPRLLATIDDVIE